MDDRGPPAIGEPTHSGSGWHRHASRAGSPDAGSSWSGSTSQTARSACQPDGDQCRPVGDRRPVAAAGRRVEGIGQGQPLRRRASAARRRRTMAQPASGVTGASVPKASGTPARCRVPNGFIVRRPVRAQPLLVQLARTAPGGVERRLHAGHHPELGQRREVAGRHHLQMLQPVPGGADRLRRRALGRPAAARRRPRRPRRRRCSGSRPAARRGCRRRGGRRSRRRSDSGRPGCRRRRTASRSAAVREPIAPSMHRSPARPAAPTARARSIDAGLGQLTPVADDAQPELGRRPRAPGSGPPAARGAARPARARVATPGSRPAGSAAAAAARRSSSENSRSSRPRHRWWASRVSSPSAR